jgi:hypothetical protein
MNFIRFARVVAFRKSRAMHPNPSAAGALAAALCLCLLPAYPAGFSRPEWNNPGQAGSVIWIRNERAQAVTLDSLYVRNLGFEKYGEAALNAGRKRLYYSIARDARGRWARLIRKGGSRIRIRGRDSLMLSGFECGARLKPGKGPKQAAEEFVLDLKVVDNLGDTASVKVTQSVPRYYIEDNPGVADSGPRDE